MKSRSDPILIRVLALAAALVTLVAAVSMLYPWAISNPKPIALDSEWEPNPMAPNKPDSDELDYALFDVTLWDEPETVASSTPAMVVPATPPSPPVPRLELIGILTEPSFSGQSPSRRAVLYDPDRDELVFASAGESVASVLVQSIDESTVRLSVADQTYRIPLDADPGWED